MWIEKSNNTLENIKKNNRKDPSYLPVMEDFHTIQGEGHFSGCASYFIRLGGCKVGCHWCDVKESWDAASMPWLPTLKLAERASVSLAPIAVITGGEPLTYDLTSLTSHLQKNGLRTHLETSGAYQLSGTWDWICLSPKKFMPPIPNNLKNIHELKVVIYHKHDFEWAEKYQDSVGNDTKLYLQPEWSKRQDMIHHIIEYVKYHPKWKISLQAHKYMQIP